MNIIRPEKAAISLFSYHLDDAYFYQELFKKCMCVCIYTQTNIYIHS